MINETYINTSNYLNETKNDFNDSSKNKFFISFLYFYLFFTFFRIVKAIQNTETPPLITSSHTFNTVNVSHLKKSTHKNKDKLKKKNCLKPRANVLIQDVVGLESVKKELRYYIQFIRDRKKYLDWNVKLPKGVLLAGPPGTGKTMLVKALAAEINIPVITTCASEFVEVYVGVGASRIRSLFKEAKSHEKCIVFIDELDAIGSKRGNSNNSERDTTLNQLLVEMDGFQTNENIMVFAATNFVSNLDKALTRSGRFDKKVYFDPPNPKEREKLFENNLKNIKIPRSLPLKELAKRSAGLTGADIANICNLAKINAIQTNSLQIKLQKQHLLDALDEVMIGREKKERMMTENELFRVAHHEAGHAFMGYILSQCSHPIQVSIIPRGEAALGFSQQEAEDKKLYSKQNIMAHIAVLLGGRAAEKIYCGDYSTGASDDLQKVADLLYNYSCHWGMNAKIGPLNVEHMRDIGKSQTKKIFSHCKHIAVKQEEFVSSTLTKHTKYVEMIAQLLLKKETISQHDIESIIPARLKNSLEPPDF